MENRIKIEISLKERREVIGKDQEEGQEDEKVKG